MQMHGGVPRGMVKAGIERDITSGLPEGMVRVGNERDRGGGGVA